MTSCVAIALSGWQIRIKIRHGGERREAAHMSGVKGCSNIRQSGATTLPLMPLRTSLQRRSKNGRQRTNGERYLEHHSQTDDTPNSRAILESQLRENYGRVVYSHKTHEKCADILRSEERRVGKECRSRWSPY